MTRAASEGKLLSMGSSKSSKPAVKAQRFHADMVISEALVLDERVPEILDREFGLPCARCVVADSETFAEGCGPLGLEVEAIVRRLNGLDER